MHINNTKKLRAAPHGSELFFALVFLLTYLRKARVHSAFSLRAIEGYTGLALALRRNILLAAGWIKYPFIIILFLDYSSDPVPYVRC